MRNRLVLAVCALIAASGVGCASNRTALTYDMIQQNQLTPEEQKGLQYYISETITLRRSVDSGERRVAQGRLVTRDGRWIEEITIPKDTPGVAVEVGPDWIDVSFEAGEKLRFGSAPSTRQRWQGKYALYADRWEGTVGYLTYAGLTFQAVEDSGSAYLLVDGEAVTDVRMKQRRVPGMRLPGAPPE